MERHGLGVLAQLVERLPVKEMVKGSNPLFPAKPKQSHMKNLTVFGKEIIDQKCIDQINNCIGPEDIGVLTPDAHYGYGHPIGVAMTGSETFDPYKD